MIASACQEMIASACQEMIASACQEMIASACQEMNGMKDSHWVFTGLTRPLSWTSVAMILLAMILVQVFLFLGASWKRWRGELHQQSTIVRLGHSCG